MKAVGVEFKDKGKLYTFFDNDLEIKLNDKVIFNTERGFGLSFFCCLALISSINNCALLLEDSSIYFSPITDSKCVFTSKYKSSIFLLKIL